MTSIMIEVSINAPISKVWKQYTEAESVKQWNNASPDWHTPHAQNDLRKGGKFIYRMEAKDGSFGFDFGGVYDEVIINRLISYTIGDGRKVKVSFSWDSKTCKVVTEFEAEKENPIEMQRKGWQAILNNFKRYVETH